MARDPSRIPDSTLQLILAQGIGPRTLRRLRRTFGGDDRAVAATVEELRCVDGIGPTTARALRRAIDRAEPHAERALMQRAGARLVLHGDPDYPALLETIDDAPAALWLRGAELDQGALPLAVVGSRRCTSYGRAQAARLSSLLTQCGVTIVSGGAFGIDAEAHRGALRAGGRTICVLGSGLARPYPQEHVTLFDAIVEQGGSLISELPMTMPPRPAHFPRRNRIISGMSAGVLVVEAGRRSGALITARMAAGDHGREVMAVPGRVDSPASSGCLQAIREGWAALVVDHADVLAQLESAGTLLRGALQAAESPRTQAVLSDRQRVILRALADHGASGIDRLASRTGLAVPCLLAELTLLEIRGILRRRDGAVELLDRAAVTGGADPAAATERAGSDAR